MAANFLHKFFSTSHPKSAFLRPVALLFVRMNAPPHLPERGDTQSAFTLQQALLMAAFFGVLALTLQAAQPSWWKSTGAASASGPVND
jgi:hypothetical protein